MRILTIILSLFYITAFAEEDTEQKMAENEVKVLTSLAQQGNAGAQYKLGEIYRSGRSVRATRPIVKGNITTFIVEIVKKDSVQAAKWYLKSAQQGFWFAQYRLAYCYLRGEGVKKDLVEAYAYFNLAGLTSREAGYKRIDLESVLTPSQLEAGQKRFKELQALIEANKTAEKK
jgi:TPR repeat protein